MQEHWEHHEHGADIGVRGIGATDAAGLGCKVARLEPLACVKG